MREFNGQAEQRQALRWLTEVFDRVWYGRFSCAREEYDQFERGVRGLVLPVGGIKEKVLAALRAEIQTVLLPERNKRELEEIPTEARERLTFIWLETVDDAMRAAVSGQPAKETKAA